MKNLEMFLLKATSHMRASGFSWPDSEDLASEAYLRGVSHGATSTRYYWSALWSAATDLRRMKHRQCLSVDHIFSREDDAGDNAHIRALASPDTWGPVDDALDTERRLSLLSERDQRILLMRGHGYLDREIADTLGITESGAKTARLRAQSRLEATS